jgi:dCTP diphosphatase
MNGGGATIETVDSIAQLAAAVRDFNARRQWSEPDAKDLAISIAVEAAELLEHFQWGTASSADLDYQAVRLEVADVMIYLLHFCRVMNIDPAQAVVDKLAINETRFPAVPQSEG